MRSVARYVARLPLVRSSRRAAGIFVAPMYRDHISTLDRRVGAIEAADVVRRVDSIERHMPSVMNAISSVNGTTRLFQREIAVIQKQVESIQQRRNAVDQRDDGVEEWRNAVDGAVSALRESLAVAEQRASAEIARLDAHVREELWPLAATVEGLKADHSTVAWLVQRIESVRAEMLYELRYGAPHGAASSVVEARIVNADALERAAEDGIRVNLGCGLLPLDGYVNVDMRELPGVDVVADVDDLPFEPGELAEISSAHTLEHVPQEKLERTLLPYWLRLLRPGGTFRAIVPDLEAMIGQFQRGEIPFEQLRLITYGGQEYEGDFHFTGFTPDSLSRHLTDAGFVDVRVLERGRPNGDCLEFEIVAHRPT